MSKQSIATKYIEITPGVLGGKPRIADRRISVAQIAQMYLKMGESIEEIAREYNLSPASVHAAMTYYYENREEMDRRTAEIAHSDIINNTQSGFNTSFILQSRVARTSFL